MILFGLSVLIKMYFLLNSFQKGYYEYKGIIKFIIKKYHILFFSTILLLLLELFKIKLLSVFLFIWIAFEFVYLLKRTKLFLKVTKRIIRLFITILTMVILSTFLMPYYLIDLLIPFFIVLANITNYPLEFLINKRYIKIAKNKVDKIKAIKIAITGSYGKTSTKNYIASVLKQKYIVKETPKSYNTPLGIARFINETSFYYSDFVIYEFGARKKGDIDELKKIYSYDIAIVTGIGLMHIDTFKTLDNIIMEKMSLVDETKMTILNYENSLIRNSLINHNIYSYGLNHGMYRAKNIKLSILNSEFDLYVNGIYKKRFIIKPLGRGAILNILPVIILCDLYKIDYNYISDIRGVDNRLSMRMVEDYYILDDAYNSNILGACYALEVLETHNGMKFLITPGFAEMDLVKDELVIEYAKAISDVVDFAIFVRNEFTVLLAKEVINTKIIFAESFKEAFEIFLNNKEKSSIVLIENDLLE